MREAGEAPDGLGAALNGDALRLPFPDDTFDRIICSEVFEHIPDDSAAMAELARVLRPGGVLAATVPSWFPEKVCWALSAEYHAPLAPGGHVRIYTEGLLRSRLDRAGLVAGASHRAHALHTPYWWLKLPGRTHQRRPPGGPGVPPPPGLGHHRGAEAHPDRRAAASIRCSARARWSTRPSRCGRTGQRPRPTSDGSRCRPSRATRRWVPVSQSDPEPGHRVAITIWSTSRGSSPPSSCAPRSTPWPSGSSRRA